MVQQIMGIIIAALLSQNFILVKFYGICPFMGVSKKIDTALHWYQTAIKLCQVW